jgi:radical SAM superfamily enzyme with C-terminal helix-hairpin-helix motif
VFDDTLIFKEFLQSHTSIAVHPCAGTDTTEKDERLLQSQESAGVSKFTFRLVRNDGPAQWVVVIANRIPYHIDRVATESESCIRIHLKHLTSGDLAKNIA